MVKVLSYIKKCYKVLLDNPYLTIKRWFFKKRIKHIVCDIREIVLREHSSAGFNRYDIIVRLLAIENYYGANEYGFILYEKQQRARSSYDCEHASERFRDLILSYDKNGYDITSEIQLDKTCSLFDGSHRVAMALWRHQYKIACQVLPKKYDVFYGIDWYIANGFTQKEIGYIQNRYEKMLRDEFHRLTITTLWLPDTELCPNIQQKISMLIQDNGGKVIINSSI